MSAPPTEAGELVSNNSLFSDSIDFDRAEKPITEQEANELAEEFNDPAYSAPHHHHSNNNNDDSYEDDGDSNGIRARRMNRGAFDAERDAAEAAQRQQEEEEREAAALAAVSEEPAPFLKPRAHADSAPGAQAAWVPIAPFPIPGDDKDGDDEFDISTAMRPEAAAPATARKSAAAKGDSGVKFLNGSPDVPPGCEITNCFDEPGLLYRIIDRRHKTWAFYNDSTAFEIHVLCAYGPQSKIEPLGSTRITKNDKKEHVAEVVVYPGETEPFVKGYVNGFTSKLRALPLSDEYYAQRSAAQHAGVIAAQVAAVEAVARDAGVDPANTEALLDACIQRDVPFVDLSFPPTQRSVEPAGAERRFKTLPWARPRQYLRDAILPLKRAAARGGQRADGEGFDDQVRLFRRPVSPGSVDGGELGDCWLQCAVATVSEDPAGIVGLFRHPKGAAAARAERRVGAYRVTLNKNGLWRSVVVDDFFPVVGASLKFARAKATGDGDEAFEIWPAVLQKAYAKLHGSYAAIMSGDPVHALTDLTGAPSYRFDDAISEASVDGGEALFEQLQRLTSGTRGNNGGNYQVILTTPGKAPALIPGSAADDAQYDFSEEPGVADALRGTGLLPGHAYTVLQVRHFRRDGNIKLVQVRNPWPYTPADAAADDDEDEEVAWGNESPLWRQHGNVARECEMVGAAAHSGSNATARWFAWSDVVKYFSGGGVVFHPLTGAAHAELRVPITFSDCRPSLAFELSVAQPTEVFLTMSNMDRRGAGMVAAAASASSRGKNSSRAAAAAEDLDNNSDYPPIMLSLAMQNEKVNNNGQPAAAAAADDVFRVVMNTSADAAAPSDSKWTFLQAREIAMKVELNPADGPYLLIPRLMEDEETMGGDGGRGEYGHIEDIHLANNYARLYPEEAAACAARTEIPVTIGVLGDGVSVALRRIAGSNSVFENFPKFPTDGDVVGNEADVYFQSKDPRAGYAVEKLGPDVY